MPIYDFHCTQCGHDFEMLVRLSATPACPQCCSEKLEKLVSLPAAPGKSSGILAGARAQAAREGHFSHYQPSERPRRK